jgi:hypothetical protein
MIVFEPKPISLFPSYRPMYRIAQILLILYMNCKEGKSSLLKLHLFSWGFKSEDNLDKLKLFVTSNFGSSIQYFGIEPSLNRALNFALGEELIGFDGNRYFIKEKGVAFVKLIINDKELFENEKPILKLIGKRIGENQVVKLEKRWKNA